MLAQPKKVRKREKLEFPTRPASFDTRRIEKGVYKLEGGALISREAEQGEVLQLFPRGRPVDF